MAAKSISIEKPGKQNQARLTESIESEELARALMLSAGTGIYIVQEGKFQYVNPLFQELTGYSQEELLGTYSLNLVHPEDRQIVRKKAIENLKGQQSPFPYEYRFIKKDGNILWVLERVTSTEYRGKRAAVGSFMDITERKHMEEALKESEERYRDLFENANDLVQSVNPSGRFTYVNRKWLEVLEYTKDEVENLTLGDVLRRDQIPHCMELFKRVCSGEDVTGAETVFISKSGKEIYVEGNVNPRFQDGEFVATQGIFRDITERKQAEEKLRESQERYIGLYEGINEAVVLYGLPDLKISHWNKRYEDLHKLLLTKDIEGTTISDMSSIVEADDWDKAMEGFAKTLAGELVPDVDALEVRMKDMEGKRRVLEVKPAFYKENGQVVGIQVAMADITERKRVEEALKASEELFRSLFDAMSEGVLLMDATGQILQANSAAKHFLGFKHSESRELSYDTVNVEAIHPDGSSMLPKEIPSFRVLKEKRPVTTDLTGIKHPDGTIFWFIINAIPLFGSNNELSGVLTTFTDITERKQAEREREDLFQELEEINSKLQQSNKELQDFAYIASHDLREPLRKISSFGALLQDSLRSKLDEDQQENFGFMIDGAERMQNMIDDLLTYSRLTTRAKPLEQVDLNKVIKDLKNLELATLLDETKGAIHVPQPLPPVQGDLSQMHQLLQNLIGNGLKFHRKGIAPGISIHAHQIENNMVRIEVQDNGIGIDEQYHEQIFTMFKRLHSREQYEGTGIGLAICKKIVNRHGGDIGIKSAPGEGTTFWFTLPRGSYSGDN